MKAKTTGALTIIALAVVAVLVVVFWRDAAVETVYPVLRARRSFIRPVSAWLSGLWEGAAAQAENIRLRRERDALRMQNADRAALVEENRRLRQALDFRARTEGRWIAAGVLSTGGGAAGARKTIRVDRGSGAGVAEGMIVRVPEGLVGRVVAVTAHTAEVLLVTDPALKVACTLEGYPKSFGLLWGGTEERLVLRHLKVGRQVAAPTRVLTSGLGGVFPAGIPVGTLLVGDKAADASAAEGDVQPTVDFATLEDVFIRCEE
ncbi:MAG: rod shape-determining protein MreC [Kiritimatiellia bacterium]